MNVLFFYTFLFCHISLVHAIILHDYKMLRDYIENLITLLLEFHSFLFTFSNLSLVRINLFPPGTYLDSFLDI